MEFFVTGAFKAIDQQLRKGCQISGQRKLFIDNFHGTMVLSALLLPLRILFLIKS